MIIYLLFRNLCSIHANEKKYLSVLREIREIFETPSKYDLKQFSGELFFFDGEVSENITISSIHDTEEETNEVFAIRLLAAKVVARGDTASARISNTDNAAILTGKTITRRKQRKKKKTEVSKLRKVQRQIKPFARLKHKK